MDITEKVRELVKPQYDKLECWVHAWPHIGDVVKNSREIAVPENLNVDLCVISAYCHDLGRVEEEARKKRGEYPLPHALLSIEPSVKVLQEVGISGIDFNEIMEAVTIHSYKYYTGKNDVARVLQDADKISCGFGPYRFLTLIKYFGGKDYVNPKEIVNNRDNQQKLEEFCNTTMGMLDGSFRGRLKGILDFHLEWFDTNMFHTESAQRLVAGKDEYLRNLKNSLS